ncbi:two-component system OmpR family sensor kinase [Brevibacterium sanguinis]|uniref:histidine kinase n=2 Tax=Brevibacterium TaxID=1696 RepID=A0A366ICT2_9MICO|nr:MULTISPECIES: ATP-binding protein [Brevibacterium]RBP62363.1 two-component system OmpR family sensor kinase [Brevibacterium sanguinis]RBP68752.1 two-component system OmpR family sensor kinase [Brevibacterium celere]
MTRTFRARRMTLRSRLIAIAVSVLVIVGFGIGAASYLTVRSSLMGDLDSQLQEMAAQAGGQTRPPGEPGPDPGDGPGPGLRYLFQPGVGDGAVVVAEGAGEDRGLIARTGSGEPLDLPAEAVAAFAATAPADGSRPETVTIPDLGAYRVVSTTEGVGPDSVTTVFGLPQARVDASLGRIAVTTALVVTAGVVLTAVLLGVLIHRQLGELRDVARTARKVTELDLGAGRPELSLRVPDELAVPGTEVGDVGASMNRMLDHVSRALEERYRGNEQMRRFVADASHELRTPIATIRGWADLTKPHRENVPPEVSLSLSRIDSGAERMSRLVDDLLLLARLEAGRQPEEGTTDVSAILVELVEDAHVVHRDHDIALDLPPRALEVRGTGDRVRQVVSAVVTNACVHTPPGTRVSVEARAEGRGSDAEVVVSVTDDGPGIPEEIVGRVFDRFVRGDSSRSREDGAEGGSSGLGLAIVKGLVDLMGGSVAVDSSASGTTFLLRFRAV